MKPAHAHPTILEMPHQNNQLDDGVREHPEEDIGQIILTPCL
jgi:hypothetical protein